MVIFRWRKSQPFHYDDWPGVSVVIAHKNHTRFLKKNLPFILNQHYPEFEIIIVDDNSTEAEKSILVNLDADLRIHVFHSELTGKKSALATGIEKANYDLILCTDADCKPVSDQWIKKMVQSRRTNEVAIGYSPMRKANGLLNLFSRFETIETAMQYFSWTKTGMPYMAVGRNMLYPRSLFLRLNPYQHQQQVRVLGRSLRAGPHPHRRRRGAGQWREVHQRSQTGDGTSPETGAGSSCGTK